jgi:hypothetical protein
MPELYRSMQKENDRPRCCPGARCLGVRVGPGPKDDIAMQEDGFLHPDTGGMTVSPDDPMFLPEHRRPKQFGGRGRDPVWVMSHDRIADPLFYRPDDPDKNGATTHAVIEPAAIVTEARFQEDLASTQAHWREVTLIRDPPGEAPAPNAS